MADGTSQTLDALQPQEKSGTELINEINELAPLSDITDVELVNNGWKSFYSFRERKDNGSANSEHLRLALEAIQKEVPQSARVDWDVCRARMEDPSGENNPEHRQLRALLKKETETRIEWEKSRGYR